MEETSPGPWLRTACPVLRAGGHPIASWPLRFHSPEAIALPVRFAAQQGGVAYALSEKRGLLNRTRDTRPGPEAVKATPTNAPTS